MNRRCRLLVASMVVCAPGTLSAELPQEESLRELHQARQTGWQLALVIVEKLEAGDQTKYPGIQAWLNDFREAAKGIDPRVAPDQWPPLDIDALVTRNPDFWQAYYEIAPADPGLNILHAGLLLSAGEAARASHLIVVAGQRPGVPKQLQQAFQILLAHTQNAAKKSNELVSAGIKLYDQGDYAGALKKHREALDLWPQNGFAHYEVGLTLRQQELIAAGEKPPRGVSVNRGKKHSPEVDVAFAQARRHDPFQVRAYQGDNQEVIKGFLALAKKGLPAWQKVARQPQKAVEDEVLEEFAEACQQANHHELALTIRQVLVARRGGYAAGDHPFISTSLRKLVPGVQTEAVLERLGGRKLDLHQLVVPEAAAP